MYLSFLLTNVLNMGGYDDKSEIENALGIGCAAIIPNESKQQPEYSMLVSTIFLKDAIYVSKFSALIAYLKKKIGQEDPLNVSLTCVFSQDQEDQDRRKVWIIQYDDR